MANRIHQDVYISLVFILTSIFLYTKTFSLIEEAALFPRALLLLFAAFSAFILIGGIKKTKAQKNGEKVVYEGDEAPMDTNNLKSPLLTLLIVGVYVIVMTFIGFFPATILFMAGFLAFMKVKNWKVYVFTITGLNLFIYLVFILQLNVQLPVGLFFE
jgi:putative tricarboxylic transport membrane protein